MERNIERSDFEILGYKLRTAGHAPDGVSPVKVVTLVKKKLEEFQKLYPQYNKEHLLIMVALNFAEQKVALEQEYKLNLADLKAKTLGAIEIIEEVAASQSLQ